MSVARIRLATLAACAFMTASQASAMTVGDYRQAYATAHTLDAMTTDQRETYVAAHRPELEFAHAQLEAAEQAAESLIYMNLLQMETGRPPFVCNYDEEVNGEIEVDEWIDEFRKEALIRFKLEPGEKSDKILDQVEINDVLAHKMMEKYPCPMPKAPRAAKAAAKVKSAKSHAEHAANP
jgi:hypothetical protein